MVPPIPKAQRENRCRTLRDIDSEAAPDARPSEGSARPWTTKVRAEARLTLAAAPGSACIARVTATLCSYRLLTRALRAEFYVRVRAVPWRVWGKVGLATVCSGRACWLRSTRRWPAPGCAGLVRRRARARLCLAQQALEHRKGAGVLLRLGPTVVDLASFKELFVHAYAEQVGAGSLPGPGPESLGNPAALSRLHPARGAAQLRQGCIDRARRLSRLAGSAAESRAPLLGDAGALGHARSTGSSPRARPLRPRQPAWSSSASSMRLPEAQPAPRSLGVRGSGAAARAHRQAGD